MSTTGDNARSALPGSLHCGGGWSGSGGVISPCTGCPGCRKLPRVWCPMIFSRWILRTINDRQELLKSWSVCPSSAFLLMWFHPCVLDVRLFSAWFHIDCLIQIGLDELRLVKQTSFKSNSYMTPAKAVRYEMEITVSENSLDFRDILPSLEAFRRSKFWWHVTHPGLLTLEYVHLGYAFVTFLHS